MWGTIAGSHVSVYVLCVYACVCVCVGCSQTVEPGSGLFWWRFLSGFVYALKSREHKVRPKTENGDCVWVPLHLCVVQLFMQNITRRNLRRKRQIKLSSLFRPTQPAAIALWYLSASHHGSFTAALLCNHQAFGARCSLVVFFLTAWKWFRYSLLSQRSFSAACGDLALWLISVATVFGHYWGH